MSQLTTIAVIAAVAITAIAGYLVARINIYQQLDRELLYAATESSEPIIENFLTMGGIRTNGLGSTNMTVMLVRADGSVVPAAGSEQLVITDEEVAIARLQSGSSTRNGETTEGTPQRIAAIPLDDLDGRYALVIGRPLMPYNSILTSLLIVLITSGVLGIAAASVVGTQVARASLRPLRRLAEAVSRVTETEDLQPITIAGQADLGTLITSFNTMLVSLNESRERQKQLIADAGHELRTPLTSLRTNIELLVADENTGMLPAGAREEILSDIAAQLAEFTSLIGDLVLLTREDGMAPAPEPVDLRMVTEHAVDRVRLRGKDLLFDVDLQPYYLDGEPDALERAILNLLDNAVKFSPPGGTITVRGAAGALSVADEGPGIPTQDLDRVFDRFYRAESARATPGTGLGLSIVAQTVARHGGTISVSNGPNGGAVFTMGLPGRTEPPEDITA